LETEECLKILAIFVDKLEKKINEGVYKLYGLNEKEIKIIENSNKK